MVRKKALLTTHWMDFADLVKRGNSCLLFVVVLRQLYQLEPFLFLGFFT